ncbi:MAG: Flp pilus assembly protein CpaB [Paracoccaceae bacterium]
MRIIAVFFIILGVALAGGAAYFGNEYLTQVRAALAKQTTKPELAKVWAAQRRLNYGDKISNNNWKRYLRQVEWPAKAVPEGAFRTIQELLGEQSNEVRTILRTIEPGELILQSKVTGFGESSRMATRVSEGKRAFTIPINAVSGVAGHVLAGDRVDILVTRTISRQLTTSVILQNVLVIATDQRANTEQDRARVASTATVEVSPTEAQKLVLAQQVGRLTLTLRGAAAPSELSAEESAPVQVKDLPDQPEILAPVVEEEKPAPVDNSTRVRVRKGGAVEEIRIE